MNAWKGSLRGASRRFFYLLDGRRAEAAKVAQAAGGFWPETDDRSRRGKDQVWANGRRFFFSPISSTRYAPVGAAVSGELLLKRGATVGSWRLRQPAEQGPS